MQEKDLKEKTNNFNKEIIKLEKTKLEFSNRLSHLIYLLEIQDTKLLKKELNKEVFLSSLFLSPILLISFLVNEALFNSFKFLILFGFSLVLIYFIIQWKFLSETFLVNHIKKRCLEIDDKIKDINREILYFQNKISEENKKIKRTI